MKQKSTHAMGAMHPLIFFVIVYGISLFLAFFVCSTVYYTFNGNNDSSSLHETVAQQKIELSSGATASAFR